MSNGFEHSQTNGILMQPHHHKSKLGDQVIETRLCNMQKEILRNVFIFDQQSYAYPSITWSSGIKMTNKASELNALFEWNREHAGVFCYISGFWLEMERLSELYWFTSATNLSVIFSMNLTNSANLHGNNYTSANVCGVGVFCKWVSLLR